MSNEDTKSYIIGNIKAVYKTALDSIELRFGRDFEGFQVLRAKILRAGNDAVRKVEALLDEQSKKDES
jgi:hypothetical protein